MTASHTPSHTLKRKNVRLKHPRVRTRWASLLWAFGLAVAWLGVKIYTMASFHNEHAPLLYPLWLLANSPHQWIVVVLLALAVIFFHVQALQKLHWLWVSLSGLFHAGLIALAFLFCMPAYISTHQQSLIVGPHTYHLVHTQSMYSSWGWGHQMYLVMECDPTGLICRYDGTPYTRYNDCFATDGALILNPTTEKIFLRVANDTFHEFYEVGLPDTWSWTSCPVKGLQR